MKTVSFSNDCLQQESEGQQKPSKMIKKKKKLQLPKSQVEPTVSPWVVEMRKLEQSIETEKARLCTAAADATSSNGNVAVLLANSPPKRMKKMKSRDSPGGASATAATASAFTVYTAPSPSSPSPQPESEPEPEPQAVDPWQPPNGSSPSPFCGRQRQEG
jgi:hypothetical protein